MTTIYLLPIEKAEQATGAYCAAHFPNRYAKAQKLRSADDRRRSIGVGILLDKVLGLQESQLSFGAHGKPSADSIPQKFSISHSGGYSLLAVSDCEIGADMETVNPRHLAVARRVCTKDELDYLNAEPKTRFFALWTMKESVSKALGKGLSLSFASFSVLPLLQGDSILLEDKTFFGQSFPFVDSVISVCTVGKREGVEVVVLE